MAWESPKYTKSEINKAGKIFINKSSTAEEKLKALDILDNWRAVHSYPMHVFQMRLRDKSQKIDDNSLVAQRLKRVPAIIFKLRRSFGVANLQWSFIRCKILVVVGLFCQVSPKQEFYVMSIT